MARKTKKRTFTFTEHAHNTFVQRLSDPKSSDKQKRFAQNYLLKEEEYRANGGSLKATTVKSVANNVQNTIKYTPEETKQHWWGKLVLVMRGRPSTNTAYSKAYYESRMAGLTHEQANKVAFEAKKQLYTQYPKD